MNAKSNLLTKGQPPKAPKSPIAASIPAQQVIIHQSDFDSLPNSAWVRESQLVRSPKNADSVVAPLPFSAPTLWRKVAAGTFPKPIKLSERVTCWNVGQVRGWLAAQATV
jgi:prophage regulatory protein